MRELRKTIRMMNYYLPSLSLVDLIEISGKFYIPFILHLSILEKYKSLYKMLYMSLYIDKTRVLTSEIRKILSDICSPIVK